MSNEFYLIAVAATTILAAARLTRLAVYDDFPPVRFVRDIYKVYTEESDWSLLAMCGYCFSFWATLLVVLTGHFLGHVYGHPPNDVAGLVWWIACGSLAASYLAAMFVANDGDGSADEAGDEVV